MYCSKCGIQNPDGAKFCSGCGSQLGMGTVYAGFWKRVVAILIDNTILAICTIGAIFVFAIGGDLGSTETDQLIAGMFGYIVNLVLSWLYFTLFESSSQQATLGKMVLGIVVTDLSGNRISFGRANGRYWGKIASAIILLFGFIMVSFTQKKQALHDIMAGSLVIKK